MKLITTQQYVSRLAGPSKMRKHATDDFLGATVETISPYVAKRTGQVWCAGGVPGTWVIVSEDGSYWYGRDTDLRIIAERFEDAPMLEVAS